MPAGMLERGNFSRERSVPVCVVPTPSCQVPSRLIVGRVESTITSCEVDGVGAIITVGSTVTGNRRSFAASHFASGLSVTCHDEPCRVSFCATRPCDMSATGESVFFGAWNITAAGITSTGRPVSLPPYRPIEPSLFCRGVSPCVLRLNVKETGPRGARSRTMFSFTAPRPTR